MQLFTIGLSMLNQDGSTQISGGAPIPTYTQDTVEAFARAYTGWTYPTEPGATLQKHNPAYWTGPMVAFESNHDQNSKQLLQYSGAASGGLLPAGQTAEADLSAALEPGLRATDCGCIREQRVRSPRRYESRDYRNPDGPRSAQR
jgi:uncharacterized protein (DUF1800 family)